MQTVYFHPQVRKYSFILPIDSTGVNVFSMSTVRGKYFLFSLPVWSNHVVHTASCARHRGSVPGEFQAYCLDHKTPTSSRLRMVTSATPITLIACIPFYSMIFNIDFDYDNYY
jgi:hypothetical protein